MPIAQDVLLEIQANASVPDKIRDGADVVRRKYLSILSNILQKPVIIYAANFKRPNSSISLDDVHAFMSMCSGIERENVVLVIHTPGGAINAIEAVVKYLHTQFMSMDVIVPMYAFSAGTMWCCACEKIYMGKNSFLGPIDPQIPFLRADGQFTSTPAQSIIDEFETAKIAAKKDPRHMAAYAPILQQYAPSLVTICKNAVERSKILVREWLVQYHHLKPQTASSIANWLGQHNKHKDHGRPLSIADLNDKKMNILPLEENQQLQDAALSLYHAIYYSLEITNASKIIENSVGKYIIRP